MKQYLYIIISLSLSFVVFKSKAQTIKQFNGRINISDINYTGGTDYTVKGTFSDGSGTYSASDASVGDQIVDAAGNTFEIVDVSASGPIITAKVQVLNTAGPNFGIGTIFRPTSQGLQLITNDTPEGVLVNTINTTTLSIDAKLPKFESGTTLPAVSSQVGDVVIYAGDQKLYSLTKTGWKQVSTNSISTSYAFTPADIPPGVKGDLIKMYFDNSNIYMYDGSSWIQPPQISSLPAPPKYGDIFHVTAENRLYMHNGTDWVNIGGGAVPASTFPAVGEAKAGEMFYNTSDNRLYVFNGNGWIPVDNSLEEGKLYVGNAEGIAAATDKKDIPLSDFGAASAPISMGDQAVTSLADPVNAQDAATKNYVDAKASNPASLNLSPGNILIGDAAGKASETAKTAIPLSDFGAAAAAVSMGNNAIVNLAEPNGGQDAATKNYVDTKITDPANISLNAEDFLVGNALGRAASVPKNTIPISGFDKAGADIAMGDGTSNYRITNLADPAGDQDAATKKYVDSKISDPASLALADGKILIGDENNLAAVQTLSGDITISNTGAAVIANDAVDAAKIKAGSVTVDKLASSGSADADKVYVTDAQGIPMLVDKSTLTAGAGGETFADDFVVRGVPNFLKWADGQTVPAKGKTAVQLLLEGSQMAVAPKYTPPSAGISGSPAPGNFEFGRNLGTITLSSTFTQNDAGALISTTYSRNGTPLGANTDVISNLTAPVTYTVTKTYAQGPVKNNNMGDADPSGQVPAGSVTSTITYTPVASRYYGFVSSTNPSDAEVQALTKDQTGSKALKTTLTNPSSPKYICFRYPAAAGVLTAVKVNGFSAIGAFTITQGMFTNAQGYQSSYYLVIGNNPVDNSGAATTDLDFQ